MNKLSLSMLSEWNVVHGYAGSSYSVARGGKIFLTNPYQRAIFNSVMKVIIIIVIVIIIIIIIIIITIIIIIIIISWFASQSYSQV